MFYSNNNAVYDAMCQHTVSYDHNQHADWVSTQINSYYYQSSPPFTTCSAIQVLTVGSYHFTLLQAAEVEEVWRSVQLMVELIWVRQLDLVLHIRVMVHTWNQPNTTLTIHIYLIFSETRVSRHFLCCWYYGSIFIQFFCSGLQKMHLFCNRVHIGHSRSSKIIGVGEFFFWLFLSSSQVISFVFIQ